MHIGDNIGYSTLSCSYYYSLMIISNIINYKVKPQVGKSLRLSIPKLLFVITYLILNICI